MADFHCFFHIHVCLSPFFDLDDPLTRACACEVLVGARDEASISLSEEAKTAIKTLGATMIDGMSFRAAYALVGVAWRGLFWGLEFTQKR